MRIRDWLISKRVLKHRPVRASGLQKSRFARKPCRLHVLTRNAKLVFGIAEWIQGKDKHILSGIVANRGSNIGLKISSGKGGTLALLLSGSTESTGYAYLSNDNREMHWMLAKDSEFTFRGFTRIS